MVEEFKEHFKLLGHLQGIVLFRNIYSYFFSIFQVKVKVEEIKEHFRVSGL